MYGEYITLASQVYNVQLNKYNSKQWLDCGSIYCQIFIGSLSFMSDVRLMAVVPRYTIYFLVNIQSNMVILSKHCPMESDLAFKYGHH